MKYILSVVVCVLLVIFFSWLINKNYFVDLESNIMPLDQIEKTKHFVVLWGDDLLGNSELDKKLQSKLDVVVDLYNNNYVRKIILSGDKNLDEGNAVVKMTDYLVAKNINIDDIVLDFYSPDLYSSALRLKKVYLLDDFYIVGDYTELLQYLHFLEIEDLQVIGVYKDNWDYNFWQKYWYEYKAFFVRGLFAPKIYSKDKDINFLINNK